MKKLLALSLACLSFAAVADDILTEEKFNPVTMKVQLTGPASKDVLVFEEKEGAKLVNGEKMIGSADVVTDKSFQMVVLSHGASEGTYHLQALTHEGAFLDTVVSLAAGDSKEFKATSPEKKTTTLVVSRVK